MKNKFLKTSFIILLLVFQFIVIVNAHPGRTDSNGGHYDRSTGEYHYHDGESAGKNKSSNNETYTYENFVGPTQDYGPYSNASGYSNNSSNTTQNDEEKHSLLYIIFVSLLQSILPFIFFSVCAFTWFGFILIKHPKISLLIIYLITFIMILLSKLS